MQIEELIEQEFNNPQDHDEIKYELGLEMNDDDFIDTGFNQEDSAFDDNIE